MSSQPHLGIWTYKPPLIMSITRVTGPCSHNATQPNYSLFSDLIPPAFLASGSQPELWCLVTENKYLLSTEGRSWFLHLRRFTQPSPLQPDIKYSRAEGKRCWSDLKLRPSEAGVTNWDKPQEAVFSFRWTPQTLWWRSRTLTHLGGNVLQN